MVVDHFTRYPLTKSNNLYQKIMKLGQLFNTNMSFSNSIKSQFSIQALLLNDCNLLSVLRVQVKTSPSQNAPSQNVPELVKRPRIGQNVPKHTFMSYDPLFVKFTNFNNICSLNRIVYQNFMELGQNVWYHDDFLKFDKCLIKSRLQ